MAGAHPVGAEVHIVGKDDDVAPLVGFGKEGGRALQQPFVALREEVTQVVGLRDRFGLCRDSRREKQQPEKEKGSRFHP